MKTITKFAAATLALAALATTALAQGQGYAPGAPGYTQAGPGYPSSAPGYAPNAPAYTPRATSPNAPPDPVAYAQQNLQSLRSRLNISPAQAPAWNAFVDAVINQSRDMKTMQAQMAQGPSAAPDRLARMADMMRRGADGMTSVSQALRTLYAQLDPHQRSIVDQEFARGPGGAPPPQG
jgi:hypothetical protein